MAPIRDLTGQVFGQLTAVEATPQRVARSVVWACRCACGGRKYTSAHNLVNGKTRHCGCEKGLKNG